MKRGLIFVVLIPILAGCASSAPATSPPATTPAATKPAATTAAASTQQPLAAGELQPGVRYVTVDFEPGIIFSVPDAGWLAFTRAGGDFQLSKGLTSLYFSQPRKAFGAGPEPLEVPRDTTAFAAILRKRPGMTYDAEGPVTFGAVSGLRIDITWNGVETEEGRLIQTPTGDLGFSRGPGTMYLLTVDEAPFVVFVDPEGGTTIEEVHATTEPVLATLAASP
jgi:hypothetical protein